MFVKNSLFLIIIFILIVVIIFSKKILGKSINNHFYDDAIMFDMPKEGGNNKHVVVIGGGISGLTAAKYLHEAQYKVTLLEKKQKLGGNNDPFLYDEKYHASTIIVTLPKQQPHYYYLAKEMGVNIEPHVLKESPGCVVIHNNNNMFIKFQSGALNILRDMYKYISIYDLYILFKILFISFVYFYILPENKITVYDALGKDLINSKIFVNFIMPWIGVNTWCRFNDLNHQPMHIFASFMFEYCFTLTDRIKNIETKYDGWCVLDGQIIFNLEKYLYDKITINKNFSVNYIDYVNGKYVIYNNNEKVICDKIIIATQPIQAVEILEKSVNIQKRINPNLLSELKKWKQMNCYTILHKDFSKIKSLPWIYITYKNKKTGLKYSINIVQPKMDKQIDEFVISYIYSDDDYEDYIKYHIDNNKILKILRPTLPMMYIENSVNRNKIWEQIDNECNDIYFTQACKNGLQYHNNGILSSKRVVRSLTLGHW